MSIAFLVLIAVVLIPLAVGIALIVTSRRGRRPHPSCGACGYNLTASIGSVTRCPECGAEFAEVGILPPRRTTRPVMLGMGIALLAVSATCVAGFLASTLLAARRTTVIAPAPPPPPAQLPPAATPAPQAEPAPSAPPGSGTRD